MRRRHPVARRALWAFAVLALVAAAGGLVLRYVWAGTLPARAGTLRVPGLGAPATVTWDPRGVPTIEAASFEDALRAEGFVHGLVRPMQVELRRRATIGAIAAFAGARALPLDEFALQHGFAAAGARDAAALDPAERRAAEAYLAGLNAGLAEAARSLPPAPRVAGLRPEPWTLEVVLGFGRRFASGLSNAAAMETSRFGLLKAAGVDDAAVLWAAAFREPLPGVPQGTRARLEASRGRDAARPAARDHRPADPPGGAAPEPWLGRASNAWAVAGARTADGAPLMAGDPHLDVELPAIWYDVRLRWPGGSLAGASLPGVPGVVIGHNDVLAWSFTTSNVDDADLFLVEVDDVAAPTRYREGGAWKPFDVRRHAVKVKDAADGAGPGDGAGAEVVVRHAGPARYAGPSGIPGHGLLERWAAREGGSPFPALHGVMRATSMDAAIAAARLFPGPGQNWVAASRDGSIAQAVVGLAPVRASAPSTADAPSPAGEAAWDGRNVAPWTGPGAWAGFVPPEQLPLARDPAEGFVVNANDGGLAAHPAAPGQRALTGDFETPWRAARLRERLAALDDATLDDMRALQDDARSGSALDLQPLLRACRARGPAAEIYLGWDGTMRGPGGPLLHEALRAALGRRLRAQTRLGLSDAGPYLRGTWPAINLLRASLESPWIEHQFDDPRTAWPEDGCALLRAALDDAWGAVNRHAGGGDAAARTWERWHVLTPASPVGIGPLASWFNPPAAGMAGSFDSPLAAANRLPPDGFAGERLPVIHAASYRLNARLGRDGIVSRSALPGGQDEHPASPHAWDRLAGYAAGRTDALVPPDASPGAGPLRLVP